MPKTIDISKGIEAFEDRTDFSRNNPDRKAWGKQNGADALHIGSEYETTPQETPTPSPTPTPVAPPVAAEVPKKFTHKLGNGTVLEAESVEALAAAIEKAISAPVQVLEFEDKPLYQPVEFKRKELTVQEQANILNVWKENPQKAMRMLQEAEFGAPVETILGHLSQAELRELHRRQDEAAADFLGEAEDYNPTPTNGKKLTEFLKAKNKPITKTNLMVAFRTLVAEGDKSLVKSAEAVAPPVDDGTVETPPPPTVVPSNSGLPEPPAENKIDPAKFARLSLKEMEEFFAKARRR